MQKGFALLANTAYMLSSFDAIEAFPPRIAKKINPANGNVSQGMGEIYDTKAIDAKSDGRLAGRKHCTDI